MLPSASWFHPTPSIFHNSAPASTDQPAPIASIPSVHRADPSNARSSLSVGLLTAVSQRLLVTDLIVSWMAPHLGLLASRTIGRTWIHNLLEYSWPTLSTTQGHRQITGELSVCVTVEKYESNTEMHVHVAEVPTIQNLRYYASNQTPNIWR